MESENPANVDIFKFLPTEAQRLREKRGRLDENCADHALLKILEEGLHADITLVAQGGSVKAHRSVLASASPVFCAMFQHNMKEQPKSTVEISDMTIDGLQLFLLLLYTTNEYNNSEFCDLFSDVIDEHFAEFWEAVYKYQVVARLEHILLSALGRNLTPENCWDHFNCSQQVHRASSDCRQYILNNFDDVIESESLVKEMRRNPEQVQSIMKMAMKRQRGLVGRTVVGKVARVKRKT